MKYYGYLFLAILVLPANAYAAQANIEIVEQFDNINMVAFISINDVNESPEWDPGSDAPPLTINEAIQAVKKYIRNPKNPVDVKEIEIRRFPKHEGRWHYLIKIADDAMKSKYDIYVVLMDGKVIPAIIEPQGYK
jgi:hypothetical protein